MSVFSFFAKFSAVFAAGYGLLFAASNIVSGAISSLALNIAGYAVIGIDLIALLVWIVNAIWYKNPASQG